MSLTNFSNGVSSFGIPIIGGNPIPFTGKYYFVDPVYGSDGNKGTSPKRAFKTLYRAQIACVAGNNDVVYLIGNGSSTGTARLSLAIAQTVTPTATSGVLNWAKNACHLIGITAPARVAQRARIAPPTGIYTQANFGSGNFVNVTASGCMFANISLFHGFSTGGVNQICWTDSGSRNAYFNMDIAGIADATSAANTGSRSIKLGGAGSAEHYFQDCSFGIDTVQRGVANATLEFVGTPGAPRNLFRNCVFNFSASNAAVLGIITSGASTLDRWTMFENCAFMNAIQSTATTMTALSTLAASSGGFLLFKDCALVGITGFGSDATTRGQIWVVGDIGTAGTSGIAVAPTA